MNTQEIKDHGQDLVRQTENYVRANPVPALLGAVAVGFAIGLAVRSIETERQAEPLRDALNDIRSALKPLAKKTRKAYAESSDSVREAVETAMERVKDVDVDRYVDPVAGWWKKLWA